jgi:hypothetical protein
MTTPARKSCLLSPDDLAPRMYITIHSGRVKRRSIFDMIENDNDDLEAIRSAPTPPAGVPMQILELNLPYVACSVPVPGGTAKHPVILDIRNVCLQRVDPKFVRAIRKFRRIKISDAAMEAKQSDHHPNPAEDPLA